MTLLSIVLCGWAAWCVCNLLLFLVGAWLVRPSYPCYNGFRVHVPASYAAVLTDDELRAVVMHEHGHRARCHPWLNLARRCCFLPYTEQLRARQELQADDYVSASLRLALASALRKTSGDHFDLYRAKRLETIATPRRRDACLSTLGRND